MKKQEYFFMFEGGGWNSVITSSLKEAKIQAVKQWGELTPRLDTVKPVEGNEREYEALMRAFY